MLVTRSKVRDDDDLSEYRPPPAHLLVCVCISPATLRRRTSKAESADLKRSAPISSEPSYMAKTQRCMLAAGEFRPRRSPGASAGTATPLPPKPFAMGKIKPCPHGRLLDYPTVWVALFAGFCICNFDVIGSRQQRALPKLRA